MLSNQIWVPISLMVLGIYSENEYMDLWSLKELTEIKSGNLRYFFDMPRYQQEIASNIYKYLQLLVKRRRHNIFNPCHEENGYNELLCYWNYFYHCLKTTNIHITLSRCNPFIDYACYHSFRVSKYNNTVEISDEGPIIKFCFLREHSSIDWSPHRLPLIHHEVVVAIFNLYMCSIKGFKYLCPDVCASINPCRIAKNVRSTECKNKEFYINDIERLSNMINGIYFYHPKISCDCKDGYKWDNDMFVCTYGGFFPNPCDANTNEPCNEKGTEVCLGDTYTGNFRCRCKPQYYGKFCESLIDACMMNVVSFNGEKVNLEETKQQYELVNGSMMCLINHDGLPISNNLPNQCIPQLGSFNYECKCNWPFLEDMTLKIPNCWLKQTACYHKLCGPNAVCRESVDGKDSLCICEDGYEGEFCDQETSTWSHWSECEPDCGTFRFRTRSRQSTPFLNNDNKSILINYTQSEWCADRLESDCPINNMFSSVDKSLVIPYTNDELLFYTTYLISLIVSVLAITIIIYCSRVVTTPYYVHSKSLPMNKSRSKMKSFREKQMSLKKDSIFYSLSSTNSEEEFEMETSYI